MESSDYPNNRLTVSLEDLPLITQSGDDDLLPTKPQTCNRRVQLLIIWTIIYVLMGTADKVSFKLGLFSMHNYIYPSFLINIFASTALMFVVVLVKLLWTGGITRPMRHKFADGLFIDKFKKWKFLVIGTLAGLSSLLMSISGTKLNGILQLILLQVVLPVTMLFSLLFLRYQGNYICCIARAILDKSGTNYTEIYIGDEVLAQSTGPVCKLLINGRDIGNIPDRLKYAKPPDPDFLTQSYKALARRYYAWKGKERPENRPRSVRDLVESDSGMILGKGAKLFHIETLGSNVATRILLGPVDLTELEGEVILLTDRHPWKKHLLNFYSWPQYLGAIIILCGIIVSFYSKITANEQLNLYWGVVFVLSTIPLAMSVVYMESSFREVRDMDIWYLNAFVALPQLVFSFLYAVIAAYGNGIHLFENIIDGIYCLIGESSITREQGYDCRTDKKCFDNDTDTCCDSCNGEYPEVFPITAGYIQFIYIAVNLLYNIAMVAVVKYGSASFMYATATLVLPLGSIFFASPIMGPHAQKFEGQTAIGLVVIFLGIVAYVVMDWWWRKRKQAQFFEKKVTYFTTGSLNQ